jgi:ATP-dependent 26S proteasome regulatory subunit
LPDYEGRLEIFKILSKKMPFSNEFIPENIAKMTEGFSGAEITSICHNSAIHALERDITCLEVSL